MAILNKTTVTVANKDTVAEITPNNIGTMMIGIEGNCSYEVLARRNETGSPWLRVTRDVGDVYIGLEDQAVAVAVPSLDVRYWIRILDIPATGTVVTWAAQ